MAHVMYFISVCLLLASVPQCFLKIESWGGSTVIEKIACMLYGQLYPTCNICVVLLALLTLVGNRSICLNLIDCHLLYLPNYFKDIVKNHTNDPLACGDLTLIKMGRGGAGYISIFEKFSEFLKI